jgi:hypothetical protein
MTRCSLGIDVASKDGRERLLIKIKVHAFRAVGVRERDLPERGQDQAALVQPEELLDALPLIERPPGEEHQRGAVGGGPGSDPPAPHPATDCSTPRTAATRPVSQQFGCLHSEPINGLRGA